MRIEWEEDRRSSQASSGSSGEKRMKALVRRWEPAVQERFMKGVENTRTARFPWRQERNFLRIRGDCTEFGVTQKVTKLTETKPGNKYPPTTTQGEKREVV